MKFSFLVLLATTFFVGFTQAQACTDFNAFTCSAAQTTFAAANTACFGNSDCESLVLATCQTTANALPCDCSCSGGSSGSSNSNSGTDKIGYSIAGVLIAVIFRF